VLPFPRIPPPAAAPAAAFGPNLRWRRSPLRKTRNATGDSVKPMRQSRPRPVRAAVLRAPAGRH